MLVVADDLSGAVEAASVLGARRVSLDPRVAADAVVDLDSRGLSPDDAARTVRALTGRIAFKKIDSLLRGNVVAEIEALRGEVVVAPALPVEGRIVRDGVLHVHGVAQPTPAGLALLDAETDEDLDSIVAAAPPHATLVGSAGLAAALGRRLGATPLPAPEPSARGLLIAVGTKSAGEQLARLAATGVAVLELADAERAAPATAGRVTAVHVAGERRDGLARLAALVAAAPPVDLVLTGGETARRILDALGVTTLEPIAQIDHGAVQCRVPGGRRVTIRPGSFGGPDGLVQIVRALTC